VAAPAAATLVDPWHPYASFQYPSRHFATGLSEGVGVNGLQDCDGTIRELWIALDHDDNERLVLNSAAQARQTASALIAAADLFESIGGAR
jgi:hypothetical protein